MIQIESKKVIYKGSTPMLHVGGRKFDPGKVYELSQEEWDRLRSSGRFELMIDKPKTKKKKKKEFIEKKLDVEIGDLEKTNEEKGGMKDDEL